MKLSVSNIAWENSAFNEHLDLLEELGCHGVEIAPSCIWPEPTNVTFKEINFFKKNVSRHNLQVVALHALLFTRPDLFMFGAKHSRDNMVAYLKQLIKLAGDLGAGVLVYGSPNSRRIGTNNYVECYKIALEVFSCLAKVAESNNTCFCIEPLAAKECDFIRNADEAYKLIGDVADPGFGLHLDVRAMFEEKEDFNDVFNKYAKIIKHIHVGDPGLSPPGSTGLDHSLIGNFLCASGYDKFISIEMRKGSGDTKEIVKKAVNYVKINYRIKPVSRK